MCGEGIKKAGECIKFESSREMMKSMNKDMYSQPQKSGPRL